MQTNTGYKIATLDSANRFDINGFDVNNQTGGAYSITVTSYSDTGATTVIQTETFSVPAGASTVTLNGSHLSAVVTTITNATTTLLSFKNFQLQGYISSAPSAPTITGITAGSGQLSVAFTAGATGGSAITNYKYSTNGGSAFTAVSPAATTSPIVITGLTNGTTYSVQIKAVNAIGDGTATATSTGTPSPSTYTVTPSAGANGTISPSSAQTINSSATTTFTVTPSAGYSASVGGTCGGSLSGTTYTTNAITANCTVAASFTAILPNCTYSLSNSTQSFSANGGTGSFNVNQNETSCANSGWTATSNSSWITITSGSSGNWSITPVTFTVSANTTNAQRSGAITITGYSNTATMTITQSALLTLSANTLNYGTLKTGESTTKSATVTNVSGGSLTISGVNITGADSSDFTLTNNCSTLSNNGSCTLDVKFAPATEGSKTATLTITANSITFTVTLTGTADNNATPVISVTPSVITGYVDIAFSSQQAITISNTGTGTLLIQSIKFYGEDLYEYAVTNSCSLIRPQESCSVLLSSAYTSTQSKNASLVITSNASNAGKLEIPVNMVSQHCTAGDINISSGSATVSSTALTGVLTITATNNCWWTTSSKSDWISTNTTNLTQGNGTVNYTVSANTGSASRIGTINVGGLPFTIIQYAPGVSQSYADISGNKFEDNINALYSAGIADQATNFYPANPATKGDIAVYIIRSVYGETFTYTTTPYFSDVPVTHPSFKYVQKLKDDNITLATGVYDIDAGVKRSWAAGFIIRAIYGETFGYPAAPYFSDVPVDHVYFKYIQKMKERGFTHASTGGEYLPDNIMDRGSLAAFITDAFLGMEHY